MKKYIYFLISLGCCFVGSNSIATQASTKRDFKLDPTNGNSIRQSLSFILAYNHDPKIQIYKENADGTLSEICPLETLKALSGNHDPSVSVGAYRTLRHEKKETLDNTINLIRSEKELPCTHCPDTDLAGFTMPGSIIVRHHDRMNIDPCQGAQKVAIQKLSDALAQQQPQ